MNHTISLSKRALTAWLAPLPDDTIVGRRCDALNCPIATYIKTLGFNNPCVEDTITYGKRLHTATTRALVGAVDSEKYIDRDFGDSASHPVTAYELRLILRHL